MSLVLEAMPTQLSQPMRAHVELRYLCPNCSARMQNIRAIERGMERAQHVYKCPRCSVIMTEGPEE